MRTTPVEVDGKHMHVVRDVLEVLTPEVPKDDGQPIPDFVAHFRRDANASRLRDVLEARGDIDAVTVDACFVVENIADIDADAKLHPSMFGHVTISLRHR